MHRLKVGVVELMGNRPAPGLWNRLMKPNSASIMPQVIAVWCEQMGHDVSFVCHTGDEDPYEPLARDQIQEDLRFILRTLKRPIVGWHGPNFGIRFDETMAAIEEAGPPGAIEFAAESSLSILSEPHLRRLRKNGFVGILPGIESWYDLAGKSKTRGALGRAKVEQVSDHVNLVLRYIPYVQANFVLGLDSDEGEEPFELTKLFVDKTPGAFPAYSLFSAFGEAAPLNLELQRAGRVRPFPFHFLDNNQAMNVQPLNYSWVSLYDHIIALRRHSFSARAVARRFAANRGVLTRSLNLVRAVSTEGRGRVEHDTMIRGLLETDHAVRRFFEGDTVAVPPHYAERVRRDLGPL